MSEAIITRLFHFLSQYITLSKEEAQAFVEMDLVREYDKGSFIIRQGDVSSESFFMLQGLARSYYLVDGEERITEFYEEYAGWTPQCAVSGKPSEFYVDCLEPSFILVSTPDISEAFFEKHPNFEKLCRILSEKWMADHQEASDLYKISSAEERYLELVNSRPQLIQRVPQYQLASYLGIKPESLSRIRKRLVEKKISS